MADTERTIAVLLATTFADGQAAGSITPQDMRDLIISLEDSFGACYLSSSSATTISTVDVAVKLLGTFTAHTAASNVSMPTSNRLRNDGTATRDFTVSANISFVTASSNMVFGFGIAKNGSYDANSEVRRKTGTGSDVGSTSLTWQVELAATDYVEIFVVNRTDNSDMTAQYCHLSMVGRIE